MIALPLLLAAAALQASPVRRIPAADAEQGVASDGQHLYAIASHSIAQIDGTSGREVARWVGDPVQFPHINSCMIDQAILVCAASNFPGVPMQSMIERFDPKTLRHLSTQQLGHGYGSLTWVVPHDGDWWACFANYDGRGGEPGRDHRYTAIVKYDDQWREVGGYALPEAVLERMAPMSTSGGAWGDDDLLYVTGHDRPELYALRLPKAGSVLELVATIAIPFEGQAIDWDPKAKRLLWGISRKDRKAIAVTIPKVDSNVAR